MIETEKIICRNWSFISRKGELLLRAKKRALEKLHKMACIVGWEDLLIFFFFFFFLADQSVMAIPLVMSSILNFLRDVWIRTQRAAIASRRATNLATHHLIFLSGIIMHETE